MKRLLVLFLYLLFVIAEQNHHQNNPENDRQNIMVHQITQMFQKFFDLLNLEEYSGLAKKYLQSGLDDVSISFQEIIELFKLTEHSEFIKEQIKSGFSGEKVCKYMNMLDKAKQLDLAQALIIIGLVICGGGAIAIFSGFGLVGISGGSLAALIQSYIGSVSAGSTFATMTSLGMKGLFTMATKIGVIAVLAGYMVNYCETIVQK